MREKTTLGVAFRRKAPSLVDLCVEVAIDNVRYLGDVGETDFHLLDRILPHCTCDQLMHIENSSIGRDLTPVTDKLWKQFYKKDYGENSLIIVTERMKKNQVAFRWKQLYQAKAMELKDAENKAVDRLKKLYENADARKQSRQVQICTKVPPSSNKRSFGSGSGLSGLKSNIMKKAKIDFRNSQEVKNLAAMRKNAVQRTYSVSPTKQSGILRRDPASTSKQSRPLGRRF